MVSAEIRENIRPQSPGAVSQTLLDELNQVDRLYKFWSGKGNLNCLGQIVGGAPWKRPQVA